MPSRLQNLICKGALLGSVLALTACATASPPQPPVVAREVKLTPLPASVLSIGLKPSEEWQAKACSLLSRLDTFSGSETSTCNDSSTR